MRGLSWEQQYVSSQNIQLVMEALTPDRIRKVRRCRALKTLDVTKVIEEKIASLAFVRAYTLHVRDMGIDHYVIHDAINAACRSALGHLVRTLLYFEVLPSTE